jgi:predicted DNA-binding transcriptional regulator YafY
MESMAKLKTSYGRILSALIYKILLENADETFPLIVSSSLKKKTISSILKEDFSVEVNSRTISLTLDNLQKAGLVLRKNNSKLGGWYPVREIDEDFAKVVLLSLYSSNALPNNEIKEIAQSLAPSLGIEVAKEYDQTYSSEITPWEKRLPGNMAVINEAISMNKRISYSYALNTDEGKLIEPDKSYIPEKTVNPLSIIAVRGDFYLLYSIGGREQIMSLRLDNIYSVMMSSEERNVPEAFDPKIYMKDRPYAFTGEVADFKVKLLKDERGHENGKIRYIRQFFGNKVKYERSGDGNLYATIRTDWDSFKYWYLQYADAFTIISPEEMRSQIRECAEKMIKNNS